MTDRSGEGGGCPWCCKAIFYLGLSSFSLWLLFYTSTPICSIEEFDVSALNTAAHSSQTEANHTLRYDLKLKNRILNKRIYYDALNLAFYYKPNLSHYLIGSASFPAFRQGHHKSTHRLGSFNAKPGVISENGYGSAVFRVELATAVRYTIVLWKTKRHRLVVAADLQVNNQGSLIKTQKNKGIKLSSGTGKLKSGFDLVGILGIFLSIQFL